MNPPGEQHWLRVEELGRQLGALGPEAARGKIAELASAGESPTVLTLLGTWLDLPPPPSPFAMGKRIGDRFVLLDKLGEGAMGTVWRARQEMISRHVALKLIHPSIVTPALRARFLSEIEVLGQLNHPGIVRIFDAGVHEEPGGTAVPFFAMELLEGRTLNRWAEEHRTSRNRVLAITSKICEALQAAHDHGIVHRDLKPTNIIVRPDGQPVVVDFGIARLAGVILGDEEGTFSGTPRYAAPEQHLGRDGDFRSGESVDVYAVGVILFEMLAGRPLYSIPPGAPVAEIRRAVLEAPIPELADVLPDCPPPLNDVLARALRRDPADRFYSMRALNRALAQVIASENAPAVIPAWQPGRGRTVPGTQWRLVDKMGEGGTGQVWLGRHSQIDETCVFKFCDTEEKARTLKRELTLFRLLKDKVGRNPHFVPLRDVSLDEPPFYLMMDHCEAQDLDAWSTANPGGLSSVSEEVRLEVIAQAAEALQAAHEAGIIHRDVKPANLLVRGQAIGDVFVYVADFGIGQIVINQLLREGARPGFSDTVLGLAGSPLQGTALYLAPEILEGNAATARSDIYSLGVVFWQLIAGNLRAALDPAGWADRIADPLLREDLARCLAGAPEKRWSSAGELCASLRSLPARRKEAEQRRLEVARRERAAYRRGVLRASAVAAAVVATFGVLATVALVQRQDARRAHGELALKQAQALPQTDFAPGRRDRGLGLLAAAVRTVSDAPALRSAGATVFGLSDLLPVAFADTNRPAATSAVPKQPDETARALSHNGHLTAVARDRDGLNGEVDLFETSTGKKLAGLERQAFPWMPVAQPGLLCFSPSDKLLAIGGAATSRHILLCHVPDGSLKCYLYHGSDPLCCAWHPGGRILAVGCADGTLRLWDAEAAVDPASRASTGNQFDLPPALNTPAGDEPLLILRGHRGPVAHAVFSPDGRWLASLDAAGYLRIWTGFYPGGVWRASPSNEMLARSGQNPYSPGLSTEVRLDDVSTVTGLETAGDLLVVRHAAGHSEAFQFVPADMPAEMPVVPGITEVAWNEAGTELCCATITDLYWCQATPPDLLHVEYGQNPMGISWPKAGSRWLVGRDQGLSEWHLSFQAGKWTGTPAASFDLSAAQPGQATRTAIATDGAGRTAAYCGRRIQFLAGKKMAARNTSVIADGAGGAFTSLFWDQPGRLLGVCFRLSDGKLRLESWKTSSDFPPKLQPLPPASFDGDSIVPANDGATWIVRGEYRGLWRFNPATGAETTLDSSSFARQNAPLAGSPDGSMLAMVVDHSDIQLLALPSGELFAKLSSVHPAGLTALAWDAGGHHLASVTGDGFVQVWNLTAWREWLAQNGLRQKF